MQQQYSFIYIECKVHQGFYYAFTDIKKQVLDTVSQYQQKYGIQNVMYHFLDIELLAIAWERPLPLMLLPTFSPIKSKLLIFIRLEALESEILIFQFGSTQFTVKITLKPE